jgi:hypothetical protein
VNPYIAIAILVAVILVVGWIFDWFHEKTGWVIFLILGAGLTGWLLTGGVQAITDANMPPECKTTYVC